jgi:hypothetical protein
MSAGTSGFKVYHLILLNMSKLYEFNFHSLEEIALVALDQKETDWYNWMNIYTGNAKCYQISRWGSDGPTRRRSVEPSHSTVTIHQAPTKRSEYTPVIKFDYVDNSNYYPFAEVLTLKKIS